MEQRDGLTREAKVQEHVRSRDEALARYEHLATPDATHRQQPTSTTKRPCLTTRA